LIDAMSADIDNINYSTATDVNSRPFTATTTTKTF